MSATQSPSYFVVQLARASMKKLGSAFRGAGMLREHPDWQARAEICSRCPLGLVEDRRAYCGKPFLSKINRDEATEGCGCPIFDKAKDPAEHCPRNKHFEASAKSGECDCTWCVALRVQKQAKQAA